tara:strand:+ start:727 stop:2973 length:2247 start_codon:yes stop_codon:yes gene_type:complete
MVNYPTDLSILLTLLAKGDMSFLLGKPLKGSTTGNATLIKGLVKELLATDDTVGLQELLESKYKKEFRFLKKQTKDEDIYDVIDKVWENLNTYSKTIKDSLMESRKPDDLQSAVKLIVNSKDLDDEVFESFLDFLQQKDDIEEISKKGRINKLKQKLGFDDRKINIQFLEKTERFFANEQEPSLEDYLNKRVNSFNYCLMRILIDNLKSNGVNTRKNKNEMGWEEKTEGNITILQKIVKIDKISEVRKDIGEQNLTLEDGKAVRTITIEVNYPILYEILVESDKVYKNIKLYSIESKTKAKLEVSNNLSEKIPQYFKILNEGGQKITIESKKTTLDERYSEVNNPKHETIDNIRYNLQGKRGENRIKTKINQQAIDLLLFSVNNQNKKNFNRFFYKKSGEKYKPIPFFSAIITKKMNMKVVDSAISYLTIVGKEVDEKQLLQSWARKTITGTSSAKRKARKEKIQSILAGEEDELYNRAKSELMSEGEQVVSTIQKSIFEALNDYLMEDDFDKEYFQEENLAYEPLDDDEYETFTDLDSGIFIKDAETRKIWEETLSDEDVIEELEEFRPEISFGEKGLKFTRAAEEVLEEQEVSNKFKSKFEKALAAEIQTLINDGKNNTNDLLTIDLGPTLNNSKTSPLTLKKAITLSHFLARRYSGSSDVVNRVQKIDRLMAEKLSIGDDRMAQEIIGLAKAINDGCKAFTDLFVKQFEERMKDIANEPEKYFNLYRSTFMEKLLKSNILTEAPA